MSLVRQAMKPESRVLIRKPPECNATFLTIVDEYIIESVCRLPDSVIPQAPEPLLANYGLGNIRPYNQDINMLSCFNAGERDLAQFIELGKKSGLMFVDVWDLLEGEIVEFRYPSSQSP